MTKTERERAYRRACRIDDVRADLSAVTERLTYLACMFGNAVVSIEQTGSLPAWFSPLCLNSADELESHAKTLRSIARG